MNDNDITMSHIHEAMALCGYDLDEVMTNRTRKRKYVDLRSVAWGLYSEETGCSPGAVGRAFGWDRCTVRYSIKKARILTKIDREYRNLYDAIYGFYMMLESKDENGNLQS